MAPTDVVIPAPIPVTSSPPAAAATSDPTTSPTQAPVPTMASTTMFWEFCMNCVGGRRRFCVGREGPVSTGVDVNGRKSAF